MILRGRRLGAQAPQGDPWLYLAAAVIRRALDDAQGRNVSGLRPGPREYARTQAQQWLQNGAGGLLVELDIDPQVLGNIFDV